MVPFGTQIIGSHSDGARRQMGQTLNTILERCLEESPVHEQGSLKFLHTSTSMIRGILQLQ